MPVKLSSMFRMALRTTPIRVMRDVPDLDSSWWIMIVYIPSRDCSRILTPRSDFIDSMNCIWSSIIIQPQRLARVKQSSRCVISSLAPNGTGEAWDVHLLVVELSNCRAPSSIFELSYLWKSVEEEHPPLLRYILETN